MMMMMMMTAIYYLLKLFSPNYDCIVFYLNVSR